MSISFPDRARARSLRVLHIIQTLAPESGGPVEGLVRTAQVWRDMGLEHDVLCFDSPDAPFVSSYPGKVFALDRASGGASKFLTSRQLVRDVREIAAGYDAVIVSALWNNAVLTASIALRNSGIPYFVYTHGMLDPWFRQKYPLKHMAKQISWLVSEGPLLADARAVLFTTEEEQRLADRAFYPYRVKPTVVGYGTADAPAYHRSQSDALSAKVPELGGRPFYLYLSRIHPKKGVDLLIEAMAERRPRARVTDLVIAGPGDPAEVEALRELAEKRGVADRCHFAGMLQGDAKWGAFRECEAFVLVSHQENFGVVVAEAAACGKPLLISNKVNIWREIQQDGAGVVVADTTEGAVEALDRFESLDVDAASAMGEAARACFLERYNIQATAKRLAEVITAALR